MDFIKLIQDVKIANCHFDEFIVEDVRYKSKALIFSKNRPIINVKILIVESMNEINLNDDSIIKDELNRLECLRDKIDNVNYLNVIVINKTNQKSNNLFFANDLLKMEISFMNIDLETNTIVFHKQGYMFSSSLRKVLIKKIADTYNYDLVFK